MYVFSAHFFYRTLMLNLRPTLLFHAENTNDIRSLLVSKNVFLSQIEPNIREKYTQNRRHGDNASHNQNRTRK